MTCAGGTGTWRVLGTAAWLAAGLTGCLEPAESGTFTIGLLANLEHVDDRPVLNAAELALSDLQAAGGLAIGGRRYRVELFVEKDHTTPEGATEAARRLIHQRGVAALIGPSVSREAIRVGAVAENSRIPMISPGATHPATTAGRDYVFRVTYVDTFQGQVMAAFAAADLGAPTAAVLYDVADAYSRGIAEVFQESFEEAGGRIVAFESYTTGDLEWEEQLARVQASRPAVLFLPAYNSVVVPQAGRVRELGIDAVILGSDGWTPESLAELPAFEGAFVSEPWHLGVAKTNDRTRSFTDAYVRAFGEDPSSLAALTYDGFGLLFAAARREGVDPEALRRGLAGIEAYPGVSGLISYGESGGDPRKPAVILRIEGGRAVLHKQVPPPPAP
jgi:branched-chain amino acid transport system substrate-binding protein